MPDTLETPPATDTGKGDPSAAWQMFTKDVPGLKTDVIIPDDGLTPAPTPKPEPAKPEPKPDAKTALKIDGVPDELLSQPEAKTDPAKDFDAVFSEPPKGNKKHDEWVRMQEMAKSEVTRVRAELETTRAELTKLKELPIPPDAQARLESQQKQIDELIVALEKSDYQNSPKFKERFTAREDRLNKQLGEIGKELGVDDGQIAALIASKGKRRYELLDGMDLSDSARSDIAGLLRQKDSLAAERDEDLSRSRESLMEERRQQEEQKHAAAERVKAEDKKILGEVLKDASAKLPAFRRIEGNEAWNAEVAKLEAQLEQDFMGEGLPPKHAAESHALALAYPILAKINEAQNKHIADLVAQIEKLQAAGPGGGEHSHANPNNDGKSDPHGTFARFVAPTMR